MHNASGGVGVGEVKYTNEKSSSVGTETYL